MSYQAPPIPNAFIWRRAHSFTGLFLVLFLIQHLFTNSQAALFFGEDGKGFISAVNWIKSLPFLPLIEIFLLGVPFLIHGFWGVKYLMSAKHNSFSTDGSSPSLPQFPRNHAYTWQRITSWILLFGILAHVIQMRFVEYPSNAKVGMKESYMVLLNYDKGLDTLSKRLNFEVYDEDRIQEARTKLLTRDLTSEEQKWQEALEKRPIRNQQQVVAVADSFGLAELLMVRDTFKSPLMILLYTGLVLAACFHGFNGLWTFMISWGITLTERSQQGMRTIATFLMVIVAFLGLASVWGTYWLNLFS